MIRELNTRFGRENIGFLWVMVEPLLFAGLVAITWRAMKGPEEHGVDIIVFVISGYIPLTLFRHAVTRCIKVFEVNSSLLYHRQITIFDFLIVRFLIEMIGAMLAFTFIATVLHFFGLFPAPKSMGFLLAGWLLYSIFTLSLCLIIAPLSEFSEVLEKVLPVATYIMIPFSGTFNMVEWLPAAARPYMLWSPFVSAMEMIRYGLFGDAVYPYYDVSVVLVVAMICSAIGLALCRRVRRRLTVE
ncbi:ABC transporter permease [Sphingobium nicotianae]